MTTDRIKRLRWFVNDFANLNLAGLMFDANQWETCRKQLFRHLYPGKKLTPQHDFHLIQSRDVVTAQGDVKSILAGIADENRNKRPDPRTYSSMTRGRQAAAQYDRLSALRLQRPQHVGRLTLSSQVLHIIRAPDGTLHQVYSFDLSNPNGATLIKAVFLDALMGAGISAEQILSCENRKCTNLFISTRKPRRDRKAHYCSVLCCHRESRRRYLEDPINRKKERESNKARYDQKRKKESGYPNLRVGRSPRQPSKGGPHGKKK